MQLAPDPALPQGALRKLAFWAIRDLGGSHFTVVPIFNGGFIRVSHFVRMQVTRCTLAGSYFPNLQDIENYSSHLITRRVLQTEEAYSNGVLQSMAQHVPGTGTTHAPLAVDRGKDHRRWVDQDATPACTAQGVGGRMSS